MILFPYINKCSVLIILVTVNTQMVHIFYSLVLKRNDSNFQRIAFWEKRYIKMVELSLNRIMKYSENPPILISFFRPGHIAKLCGKSYVKNGN